MQLKDPVTLNESVVEIDGQPVEFDSLHFWADTFRHADLLRYQSGDDVQMMFTDNPETTTYELTVEATDLPDFLTDYWQTGERFSVNVENEYFDLNVGDAWVADHDDDTETITIVAKVLRQGFAHVC